MRFMDPVISVSALLLCLSLLIGMVHSEQFQRAAMVESGTFDALAHYLFDCLTTAGAPADSQGGPR